MVCLRPICYFPFECCFRWLLSQGRIEEAEAIMRKIATYNGHELPSDFKLRPLNGGSTRTNSLSTNDVVKKGSGHGLLGFLDLFRTPNMRKKTLIIYYSWFATSFVYYGLTLNTNKSGSLFVMFSIGKGETSRGFVQNASGHMKSL